MTDPQPQITPEDLEEVRSEWIGIDTVKGLTIVKLLSHIESLEGENEVLGEQFIARTGELHRAEVEVRQLKADLKKCREGLEWIATRKDRTDDYCQSLDEGNRCCGTERAKETLDSIAPSASSES